jgi:hypothetical protein
MLFQDVKAQAFKLTPSDRLALITAIIESLQGQLISTSKRSEAIRRMRGLLKTDQPAPTDAEIAEILDSRRTKNYLSC